MDEWVKEMWCIYIYNGTLLSHRKDETLPFVTTWMDLEGIMLSEISQTEKNKYYFTYMWNLKNKTNEQTKHNITRLIGTEKRWWLPEGRGLGSGQNG